MNRTKLSKLTKLMIHFDKGLKHKLTVLKLVCLVLYTSIGHIKLTPKWEVLV